jgi:uncharacterized protein YraI
VSTWRKIPIATKIYLAILIYLLIMLGGLALLHRTTGTLDLASLRRVLSGGQTGETPQAALSLPSPAPTITVPPGAAWLQANGNIPIFPRPGATSGSVAILESGQVALVVGASPDRQWWALQMPYFQDGLGWVSAGQVQVQNSQAVPVLNAAGGPPLQPTSNKPPPVVKALTNINIRSGPATRFLKVGTLETGQQAEVVGASPDKFWWLILVPGTNQQGWVARDYVIASNVDDVPAVGMQGIGEATLEPGQPFLTALFPTVNVRAGPNLTFAIVGSLSQGQTVPVIGKTADDVWWQIKFPTAPDGQGWVAAAYVQAENVDQVQPIR